MYVAPESKLVLTLANVAATSQTPVESTEEEEEDMIYPCI